jgi:predicted HTH domain antitoxin
MLGLPRLTVAREYTMLTVSVSVPESAFSALHLAPEGFAREMRIAAAIQWYAQGRISQDKAAEIAGLSRAAFIDALSAARVSPFQVTSEILSAELADAH